MNRCPTLLVFTLLSSLVAYLGSNPPTAYNFSYVDYYIFSFYCFYFFMIITAQPSRVCSCGNLSRTWSLNIIYFCYPSKNGLNGFFRVDRFFNCPNLSSASPKNTVKSVKLFLFAEKVYK
jgi:hypothetical protein